MKHLKTLIGGLILVAAVSCAKEQPDDSGQVTFEISSNQEMEVITKDSNVSDYTTLPSVQDFILTIFDATSAQVWTGKVSEWDPTTPLVEGDYTVTASAGSLEDEGFDKPYFFGTQAFTVVGEETKLVSISVYLANTAVKVECSQNIRNYYKDYSFKLTRQGVTLATFAKDDIRAAFVEGYRITLEGTLVTETKTQTFTQEYQMLDEKTLYTMYIDVPNVGAASVEITFNNTVETVELGDYELND